MVNLEKWLADILKCGKSTAQKVIWKNTYENSEISV
jgi:hypothetical protein